ncbi:MAG: oxaloacetate-decarboxylating malate dehydrogenase [Pseudomonadales bacterium]|nr:oxaloacetate-decarboxylating malate dehydrogenase [Pseudomonadales bacterium]
MPPKKNAVAPNKTAVAPNKTAVAPNKTAVAPGTGTALLQNPLTNKGTAFTSEERRKLGIQGLLPAAFNTIQQQATRFYSQLSRLNDPFSVYVELATLQDRNEYLYYYLLGQHLEEFMPIVYTPTVGTATQNFSSIFRHGRGIWITPEHKGQIQSVIESATIGKNIKLLVVTDNESILGIGDQGAGGMAISIGKLSLYTTAAGIDPATTLPVSLDVGTNNQSLLDDPNYLGWPHKRIRGEEYDTLIDEFVDAVKSLFPEALIQWEDFRKDNALNILARHKERVLSFNDDMQGTGAITLAGLLSALRVLKSDLSEQRIVVYGAGAAGFGIASQIKIALDLKNVPKEAIQDRLAVLDSGGLLVDDREYRDAYKQDLQWTRDCAAKYGLADPQKRGLADVVKHYKPTILIGTSGDTSAFSEDIVRSMHANVKRPIIMPLSNPTRNAEAVPSDLLNWTDGQALIATGSPFPNVSYEDKEIEIGQGNNVFVFPALGLASLVVRASKVTDAMITEAAQALADTVSDDELERGLLYPSVQRLSEVTQIVAARIAACALKEGVSLQPPNDIKQAIEQFIWKPEYPTY